MSEINSKILVLASASPRRKELLEKLGLSFKIIPSDIDETIENNELTPDEIVRLLALKKAEDIAKKLDYPAIVIGSDTTVTIDNMILGKPEDDNDAHRMLSILSGRSHSVISGIAIIDRELKRTYVDSVSSRVIFKELSDEEIINYIKTGEPMDKAGAYAIQGYASTFITGINGCYNNIVGLPIYKLSEALKPFGINILYNASKQGN
ncbi:MAG: Maf family protein [Cyanobacteriota bacterium]